MISILLIKHRNEPRIKINSRLSSDLAIKIKQIEGGKWSHTLGSWHIPYTKKAYNQLQYFVGKENIKPLINDVEKSKIANVIKTPVPKSDNIKKQYPQFITQKTEDGHKRKTVISKQLIVNQLNSNILVAYVPYFMNNWIEVVKKINGRRWNTEEKYWELPYVQDTIHQLLQINSVHFNFEISKDIPEFLPYTYTPKKQQPKKERAKPYDLLNDTQKLAITALEEMLILERKSDKTIKSYRTHIIGLLYFYPNVKPSQITNEQLKKYMLHKITKDKIHERTQGQILNALVAFYKRLLKQEVKLENIFRPKKPQSLPNIFSKEEVKKIIISTNNLKHKSLLMLVYSAGLRKSEVRNLQKKDILFDRKCIFVRAAKGKKDRYVLLAEKAVKYLKSYLSMYQPKYWLFEGESAGQYSETSIQKIFTNAKEKALVSPQVTFHGLRHSFATHAIENNVPLHVVKELLGHNSIKTTEVYLHISNKFRKEFKSPLDDLDF
jgi:site-specific recombinase XerD